MKATAFIATGLVLVSAAGCISVKTENEIKPIHITLDVNLKVDKELDKAFVGESMAKPQGNFVAIKDLLDRKVAGVTNKALFEARSGATDDDKILIAETNAQRTRRFADVAKSSGVSVEAVEKRSLRRFEERVPAGSGVWLQRANGEWYQK